MAHSLSNIDNYKAQLTNSSSEVFVKYIDLISEYLAQCVEAIYIRDDAYYKYIIMQGVNTISHVFKLLLLYTNNLELTLLSLPEIVLLLCGVHRANRGRQPQLPSAEL